MNIERDWRGGGGSFVFLAIHLQPSPNPMCFTIVVVTMVVVITARCEGNDSMQECPWSCTQGHVSGGGVHTQAGRRGRRDVWEDPIMKKNPMFW